MNDNTYKNHEIIYDPIESYTKTLKPRFIENASTFFDNLVKQSKIDVEKNVITNKEIDEKESNKTSILKKANRFKVYIALSIFGIIASLFIFGFCLYLWINAGSNVLPGVIACTIIFPIVAVGLLVLYFTFLRPRLKKYQGLVGDLTTQINKLIQIAYSQMKPLNELFKDHINKELFTKTIPAIKLDKYFDSRRLDYMTSKYGLFHPSDEDTSTLYVQSGDFDGNPFFFMKELHHTMGTKTYSGSKTISYSTRDSNGNIRFHTQVLIATLTHPCPYYGEQQFLVYANESGDRLSFSHKKSNIHNLDENEVKRHIKKGEKKIKKQQEKATSKGKTFTSLANTDFEVLFNALDRDNEVQYRLLFTPLAQKQMSQILLDDEVGFGDNFDFYKREMINTIIPDHLQNYDLNFSHNIFETYDFNLTKEIFMSKNEDYFRRVYFSFAPILAIPSYQQTKPSEFIYKDVYNSYLSFYEHERMANYLDELNHPASETRNILKTKLISSLNGIDTIAVKSFGYRIEKKVEYIPKHGNDGRIHNIPVYYDDYIRVEKNSQVKFSTLEKNDELTYKERIEKAIQNLKNHNFEGVNDLINFGSFIAAISNLDSESDENDI